MINGKRILTIIPARGGSKGIKDKNIIDLAGKPLISYTIKAALGCEYVDDVIVSTDSEKIAEVARAYGASVPFMRPAYLATDTAKTMDVLVDVVEELKKRGQEYDIVVHMQATSPLRTAEDLRGAIEKFERNNEISLVAVSKVTDHPLLMRKIIDDVSMEKLLPVNGAVRRQDMPEFYRVNGSIYINKVSEIRPETSANDNQQPYVIDPSHAIDIDELIDLEIARLYLEKVL